MRAVRVLLLVVIAWCGAISAIAQERITEFDVDIVVEKDGDLLVTEEISVVAEGQRIKRGIFRELPRRYTYRGVRLPYDYELISVTRDGRTEEVSESKEGNAVTWRIGSADVFLQPGEYTYEITYRVPEQVRNHPDKDEVYWNATGTYWEFPIERARASIRFPDEVDEIPEGAAYYGPEGSTRSTTSRGIAGNVFTHEMLRPLRAREGLTVAASIPPGILAPMSDERRRRIWWIENGAWIVMGGGGALLLLFYLWAWSRVGRDPAKPPVFPRYEAPQGYSPAMVHVLHNRGTKGDSWLTGLLMDMAHKGLISIDLEPNPSLLESALGKIGDGKGARLLDKLLPDKTSVTLTRLSEETDDVDAQVVLKDMFWDRQTAVFDGTPDTRLHAAVIGIKNHLTTRLRHAYYRWNTGLAVVGLLFAVVLFVAGLILPIAKNGVFFAIAAAIAAMVIVFFKLLQAPTKAGAQLASEIEGFKLYLETAEADRINTANPLGDRPPMMSLELYERFLPYAIALGVERPWTEHFEAVMPEAAQSYQPTNIRGSGLGGTGRPLAINTAVAAALTAGVAAAAPKSQSSSGGGFSSGSGGGGFSGGGGGGGGGGGW